MKFMIILCGFLLLHLNLCFELETFENNKFEKSDMENQPKQKQENTTQENDKNLNKSSMKLHKGLFVFKANAISEEKELEPNNSSTKYIVDINIKSNSGINLLFEMKADIIKQGCLKLNSLTRKITDTINIKSNLSQAVNNVTKEYVTELDTYFNSVSKGEVRSEIDCEFYFLHVVDSSHNIFSSASKLLYHSIMAPVSVELYVDVDFLKLRDAIQKTIDEEKKENLRYICQNFLICRNFPAYSDNLSKLLSQTLQQPDTNFINIITILKNVIKSKSAFLESIMDEKMAMRLRTAFMSLKHISKLREFLSVVRDIISQRYILFVNKDEKVNERIKAVKILIDIVDKTFEKVGNDYNDYQLFKVLKGFTAWDMKKSVQIMKTLNSYFKEMFNILNMNLIPETRAEIKVLISFIITGSSKNSSLTEELLANGAKFIKDDKMFLPINRLAHVIF